MAGINPLNAMEVLGFSPSPFAAAPAIAPAAPAVPAAANPLNALEALGYAAPGGPAVPVAANPLSALEVLGYVQAPAPMPAAAPAPAPAPSVAPSLAPSSGGSSGSGSGFIAMLGEINKGMAELEALIATMFGRSDPPRSAPKTGSSSAPATAPSAGPSMAGVDARLINPLQAIASDPEGLRLLNAARAAGLYRIKVGALPQYVMGEAYAGTVTISPAAFDRPADVVHALAHELGHAATPGDGTSQAEERATDALARRIQARVWPGATFILNENAYGNLPLDNGFAQSMAQLGFAV